jgi:hypothetical protein
MNIVWVILDDRKPKADSRRIFVIHIVRTCDISQDILMIVVLLESEIYIVPIVLNSSRTSEILYISCLIVQSSIIVNILLHLLMLYLDKIF